MAVPGLRGVTSLHRHRCGETESVLNRPGPLALLPVVRSPSQAHHWHLLVGSYPTVSAVTRLRPRRPRPAQAGLLSVAVVVARTLPTGCPHLLFRGATSLEPSLKPGVGKFLYAHGPRATRSDGYRPRSRTVLCQAGSKRNASPPYSAMRALLRYHPAQQDDYIIALMGRQLPPPELKKRVLEWGRGA
jgi:hypothetical protein